MSEDSEPYTSDQVDSYAYMRQVSVCKGLIYDNNQIIHNNVSLNTFNIENIEKIKIAAKRIVEHATRIVINMESLECLFVDGELK